MTQQITLPREVVEQLVEVASRLLAMTTLNSSEAPMFHEAITSGRAALAGAPQVTLSPTPGEIQRWRELATVEGYFNKTDHAVMAYQTGYRAALANAERVEHVPHVRGAMIWSKPK